MAQSPFGLLKIRSKHRFVCARDLESHSRRFVNSNGFHYFRRISGRNKLSHTRMRYFCSLLKTNFKLPKLSLPITTKSTTSLELTNMTKRAHECQVHEEFQFSYLIGQSDDLRNQFQSEQLFLAVLHETESIDRQTNRQIFMYPQINSSCHEKVLSINR